MPETVPEACPLDADRELRDKIGAVICCVDHNGDVSAACDPICVWCATQADLILETVRNHEGKS